VAFPRSKTGRALVTAAVLVALANVWVSVRLPKLIPESSLDSLLDLERRVAAFGAKERVKLLVLGNSHAITGLRPPVLAKAVGLGPDEVFSLALPAGSPLEMRLLAERYLPAFPAVKTVLCGVEEFFLTEDAEQRLRYLTRRSLPERWAYAAGRPEPEDRATLVAGWFLPVLDAGVPLRDAMAKRPLTTLARLVVDRPVAPDTEAHTLAIADYRWGSPPGMDTWQVPESHEAWYPRHRAERLVKNVEKVPRGLADLDALLRSLERHGLRVTLTAMPYHASLQRTLERDFPAYARYRAQLDAYLAGTGRRLLPAPPDLPRACFTDLDHMTPLGAERMADWLARRLAPARP
jgi:hypothetical protein